MDKLELVHLKKYRTNISRVVNHLELVDLDIRFTLNYFDQRGSPLNLLGHVVYVLSNGKIKHEVKGSSLYDYVEWKTGLMLEEICKLNRYKTTMGAAQYLRELLENEYKLA